MMEHYSLLIVGDHEASRDVLSRRLAERGYAVTVAADGLEALALAAEHAFDLVLLDVEMRELSGLDILRRLRAEHSRTDLPIIMVTARTQGADIVEAFELGANDYVTRPIDFPVALARIGTHLSHRIAVARLRESEERYALAVSGARDGLWDWNLATNTVHWSARWKAMLGYEVPEIGTDPEEWFSRVHPGDVLAVKERLTSHLQAAGGYYESEHRMLHRNGTYRWVLCRGTAAWDLRGVAIRLAGSFTDVTDTKVSDRLTGLPNRHLFTDLVERALRRAQRRPDYRFALLTVGLDPVTVASESLGPVAADRLIVEVAGRLLARLRPTDALVSDDATPPLARLGGDEFHVLVDDLSDTSDAVRVAERLRSAFDEPFQIDGHDVLASASVGIAIGATGYEKPEDVMHDAATALRRAQADGSSGCELFDPAMREHATARFRIETELRLAIESSAFHIEYQPIVSVETGRITAFEALVRWSHPSRGAVGPADFVPAAESAGMMSRIDRLTLIGACRQMAAWQRRFGSRAPAQVCVNVSSRQFVEPGFAAEIETTLRASRLPPASLTLEITEGAFIDQLETARTTLAALEALGVRCSLDGFGTGYSSLSYLHQLQVNALKVDRSFVARMAGHGGGAEMVRTIVGLARILGIGVVAEGVESEDQLARLRELGCSHVQGFYFSKPLDAIGAERLIELQPWQPDHDSTADALEGVA
jgi:diguanylate cyclase (GGDEF)-like protein/PAS domain S-box-containing protein